MLAANCKDILVHSNWNVYLRDAIPHVFAITVLQDFQRIPGLHFNWLQYVPKALGFERSVRLALHPHDPGSLADIVQSKAIQLTEAGPPRSHEDCA